MRIDSAGAASDLCQAAQDAKIGFLVGFDVFKAVQTAILSLPESAWRPGTPPGRRAARRGAGHRDHRADRPQAVAQELARDHPSRATPPRSAAHLHRPRRPPLPSDPHRPDRRRGRDRAPAPRSRNAEDRIRAAKQTGLDNLPFREFDLNAVWMELSLIAQDLIAWTQQLALDGELAICEPKALRYRLLHTAGRLAFTRAARSCACKPAGHGPTSSPPPSSASKRYHHPPANAGAPHEDQRRLRRPAPKDRCRQTPTQRNLSSPDPDTGRVRRRDRVTTRSPPQRASSQLTPDAYCRSLSDKDRLEITGRL